MKNIKIYIIKKAAAVFLIGVAITLSRCTGKDPQAAPAPESLPVANVVSGSQVTYRDYPASIEGVVNLEIRPQVSGALDKVFVDEGEAVKAGQLLFKINDQPYRVALSNASASLHAAQAAQGNAQIEIDKLTPLVASGVISSYQLKIAKASHQVAKAHVESARANVAAAKINLDYTMIKAPVSGYIGRLLKKQGSLVSPQDTESLTQLSDVHDVHVYFSLGEKDFVNFKSQYPGETLNEKIKGLPLVSLLLADGSEHIKQGRIDVIDGQFDKNTGAITVRASFSNPQGLLRSGNTGKIRLSLKHNNIFSIPESATTEIQDKVFVYVVGNKNKVRRQFIDIMDKKGDQYLVASGIKSGDKIVLSGIDHLKEGVIINPQSSSVKLVAAAKDLD